jgi:hypothetical protein
MGSSLGFNGEVDPRSFPSLLTFTGLGGCFVTPTEGFLDGSILTEPVAKGSCTYTTSGYISDKSGALTKMVGDDAFT